jgi:hypothetical protein
VNNGTPWYEEGLRFECTNCGRCCSGAPGYVLYTQDDARAIAQRLGVTVEDFVERFTRDLGFDVGGRRRSFKEIESAEGHDCVFLVRGARPGKAMCAIHDLRPLQCRTFPFWPEHVESPRAWQRLGRTCEGVDRGGAVPLTQITVDREAYARDRKSA